MFGQLNKFLVKIDKVICDDSNIFALANRQASVLNAVNYPFYESCLTIAFATFRPLPWILSYYDEMQHVIVSLGSVQSNLIKMRGPKTQMI